MHKNKKVRERISLLLSFFLAFSFFVLCAGAVIKNGYLPGNTWRSYLMVSSYGTEMAEHAQKKLEHLFADRGIPIEASGKLLSQEALYTEYGCCADDIWNQRKQEKSRRETFEGQLGEQLGNYFNTQQIVLTTQLEKEIQNLVKEAGGIYDRYLNPSWLLDMITFEKQAGRVLTIFMAAAIAAAFICMVLLWQLYHHKHRAMRYICYGAEAALLWLGLLLFCLGRSEWLKKAGIASDTYSSLIEGINRSGIRNGLLVWGLGLFITLLLIVGIKYLKHKN